ncbi:hypothetical protein [Streptomyces noursei]|uniref:Uncharacterized protein n=1 Tax=Streptomyces noursei TaxID=1971 RepID=A0A2N8PQU1_STRNR|nr:hypothetical protein [Streptomyces noursei]PNE43393.1 hypothetical protein AOB60_00135 [Streptomyces noursei]
MPEPEFIYHPTNEEQTRFQVYDGNAPEVDHAFLGSIYEAADDTWVADWSKLNGAPSRAMPGFASKQRAAEALYWYAPPTQSVRSRPIGLRVPVWDERDLDLSQCGCCKNSGCECEGLNRISQRLGTPQTYLAQPSLIPAHGVLVSLLPMGDDDFLVECDTRGAGSGIGSLRRRDDGRYDVAVGAAIGIASTPETGVWAVLRAHTGTKGYARLLEGFEEHEGPTSTTSPNS